MDELNFKQFRKRKKHVGFRVSDYEKEQIDEFCQREQISKADFLRYAIQKIVNEKAE